jgi:hypothetical protein
MRADILGFDRKGQVKLVAEVKNRRNAPSSWITQLRRNLLAHTPVPTDAYFLLIFPDHLYLWKPSAKPELDKNPDFSAAVPDWFPGQS